MLKQFTCIIVLGTGLLLFSSCASNETREKARGKKAEQTETVMEEKGTPTLSPEEKKAIEQTEVDKEIVVMETNQGRIVLGFFSDVAPNHVARFKELAREGYYEGILFHRVIPGFVVQAGDPGTKDPNTPRSMHGSGGSGKNLNAEFNPRPHIRGTLSAARAQDPNSADSQFFICVARTAPLDNKYTVYGHVLEGMDVVDKIVNADRDQRDNPHEPQKILSVIIEKREGK